MLRSKMLRCVGPKCTRFPTIRSVARPAKLRHISAFNPTRGAGSSSWFRVAEDMPRRSTSATEGIPQGLINTPIRANARSWLTDVRWRWSIVVRNELWPKYCWMNRRLTPASRR